MGAVEELQEMKKGILTPEQAAKILEVSTNTLEKWRHTGRYNLPFLKIGRNVRYRAQDVAAFYDPARRDLSRNAQPRLRRRTRKAA
jgi:excisionase family DNA binding protein